MPRQRLAIDEVLVVAPDNTHVAILRSTPPAARRDLSTPVEVNRSRVIRPSTRGTARCWGAFGHVQQAVFLSGSLRLMLLLQLVCLL